MPDRAAARISIHFLESDSHVWLEEYAAHQRHSCSRKASPLCCITFIGHPGSSAVPFAFLPAHSRRRQEPTASPHLQDTIRYLAVSIAGRRGAEVRCIWHTLKATTVRGATSNADLGSEPAWRHRTIQHSVEKRSWRPCGHASSFAHGAHYLAAMGALSALVKLGLCLVFFLSGMCKLTDQVGSEGSVGRLRRLVHMRSRSNNRTGVVS